VSKIDKPPKGVIYEVSGDQISEIISSFFNFNIEAPNYKLFYHPYWFFEIHIGLEKQFGVLDATNTEIILNPKELESVKNLVAMPFEELNLDRTVGFKEQNLRYAKINDLEEAEKIIIYKAKYLFPDKNAITTVPHLINVPIWELKFKDKKIITYGNDKNYKINVLNKLNEMFPKKPPTQSELFIQSLDRIINPKKQIYDLKSVFKKSNFWLILLTLLVLTFILYFIITKIILKIA
jgi:hypothetical protein